MEARPTFCRRIPIAVVGSHCKSDGRDKMTYRQCSFYAESGKLSVGVLRILHFTYPEVGALPLESRPHHAPLPCSKSVNRPTATIWLSGSS